MLCYYEKDGFDPGVPTTEHTAKRLRTIQTLLVYYFFVHTTFRLIFALHCIASSASGVPTHGSFGQRVPEGGGGGRGGRERRGRHATWDRFSGSTNGTTFLFATHIKIFVVVVKAAASATTVRVASSAAIAAAASAAPVAVVTPTTATTESAATTVSTATKSTGRFGRSLHKRTERAGHLIGTDPATWFGDAGEFDRFPLLASENKHRTSNKPRSNQANERVCESVCVASQSASQSATRVVVQRLPSRAREQRLEEKQGFTYRQRTKAIGMDGSLVNEHIGRSVVRNDETKSFLEIEPLDLSGLCAEKGSGETFHSR